MDEIEKALVAAGVALLGAITVVIGIVGTYGAFSASEGCSTSATTI